MLAKMSLEELAPLVRKKEISPVEITKDVLEEIKNKNEQIRAYIRVDHEEAMRAAKQAEQELINGKYKGPLHGIPIGLKDIFYLKGKKVTIGSKIHKDFIPEYNATVVNKLREKGAVLTGSLNMHEYAFGVTTTNPYYGACRNPWDLSRIPSGSSGGSAAAVSADMAIASLGTETGGSLRGPAALCGVVTIKPTYGRISKYGCFPLARTLDHVGPITKTVNDAALLFQHLTGYDPSDIDSVDLPEISTLNISGNMKDVVIGIDERNLFSDVDYEIAIKVKNVILSLEYMGAKIEPIHLDTFKFTPDTYAKTVSAEAAVIHEKNLNERRNDFGDDVRARLEAGKMVTATEYIKAQECRQAIRHEFREVFKKVDVIVAPTVPFIAPKIGEDEVIVNGKKVNIYELGSKFIRPATLIGFPAMSVPCGLSKGLPIGIQVMGAPFQEETILNVGKAIESLDLMNYSK